MKLGRPLKGTEKRERVTFTLHPTDIQWLKDISDEQNKTKSEMLSKVIYFYQQKAVQEKQSTVTPESILQVNIDIPFAQILEICRKHHVKSLKVFGSALSTAFRPDSDVDLLVEFGPASKVSLFGVTRLQNDLSKIIGRNIDLRTEEELSLLFRKKVKKESVSIYEQ